MRLGLVSTVLLLAGCAFDPGALGPSACQGNGDCAPDEECAASACVRRGCAVTADCGTAQEFACLRGGCYAVTCSDGCGPHSQCGTDGYCWPRACSPTREGPPGDPSCSDGVDNDCDGLTDEDDPGCVACQVDADCDDGKQCNGRETCVDGHCVPGVAVVCTQPGTTCAQAICDDHTPAGAPCVVVPADDGSPCDDGDKCTDGDVCTGGACAGTPRGCDDDVACTDDACDPSTGACVNTPDDAHCSAGEVCRPACFPGVRGCGVAPTAIALTCPSPIHGAAGGVCEVDLGVAGQAACLSCTATASAVVPFFSDFDDGSGACALDGWTFAPTSACRDTDSTWCLAPPATLPDAPALMADQQYCAAGEWVVTRRLDASALGEVFVCLRAADAGATAADFLRLEADPTGAGAWVQLYQDVAGPAPGLDDEWRRTCVQLPAAAAHQPAVGLRLTLHSSAAGHRVYAKDVFALAQNDACADTTTLFASRFDGCLKTGWSATGAPVCPGFTGDALEAAGGSFTITRFVDTRGVAGDLLLRFDVATSSATAAEAVAVEISTVANVWQPVFAQNGPLRADPQPGSFLVDLGAVDPRARGNPSLGVRVSASSSAAGRLVDLDNVRLLAVASTCPTEGVTVAAPADRGGGQYDVAVSAAAVQPVQIQCAWDDEAALRASAPVELWP
jgi:hypothetical protein